MKNKKKIIKNVFQGLEKYVHSATSGKGVN